MTEQTNKSELLRPRNILAILLTTATLAPIFSFFSSISTPYIKHLLTIGPEQRFTLCNVQSVCESDNQSFESFLARYFNQKVTLDITYEVGMETWDPCIDTNEPSKPHELICEEYRGSSYISYDACLKLTPSDMDEHAIPQGVFEELTDLWATDAKENAFFDIPLFGNGQCRMGPIARFDSKLAILNATPGTGLTTYRIIGNYLVGGKTGLYLLTNID